MTLAGCVFRGQTLSASPLPFSCKVLHLWAAASPSPPASLGQGSLSALTSSSTACASLPIHPSASVAALPGMIRALPTPRLVLEEPFPAEKLSCCGDFQRRASHRWKWKHQLLLPVQSLMWLPCSNGEDRTLLNLWFSSFAKLVGWNMTLNML